MKQSNLLNKTQKDMSGVGEKQYIFKRELSLKERGSEAQNGISSGDNTGFSRIGEKIPSVLIYLIYLIFITVNTKYL